MKCFVACVSLPLFISGCSLRSENATQLFPVKVGSQYGYMARTGKMIVKAQYAEAGCFADGRALIGVADTQMMWGYIDDSGKTIVSAAYVDATAFSEGMAFVVAENGLPQAIDNSGAIKFTVKDAEQVQDYREGLAAYSVLTENGEIWGFLDKNGKTVIAPRFASTGFFNSGMCAVANEAGKWGFINKDGTLIIDYTYDNAGPFYGDMATVNAGGKWGVIDNTGKLVLTAEYAAVVIDKDKFLVTRRLMPGHDKVGWVDRSNKPVTDFKYDDGFPFGDSKWAAVKQGDKWGYIDGRGNFTINPTYDFAFAFDGGLAPVRLNNKTGFIDKTGTMVISPSADGLSMDYYVGIFAHTSAFSGVTTDDTAPKFVGYRWLTKFYHLQFDELKKISTDETELLMTQFAGLANMMPDSAKQQMSGIRIGVKDCRITDTAAVLTYTTSDNKDKLQLLYLVKKNGRWLVQFSKNDAMKGNEQAGAGDAADNNINQ